METWNLYVSEMILITKPPNTMSHQVFIRHTYIYKCSNKECLEEWKINEASRLEKVTCPHCGHKDDVNYVLVDQREKYQRNWGSPL
mgnify:FL=1